MLPFGWNSPPRAELLSEGLWAKQRRLPRPGCHGLDSAAGRPRPSVARNCPTPACSSLSPSSKTLSTSQELTERDPQTRVFSAHSASTFQILLPEAESRQEEKLELQLGSASGPARLRRHRGPIGPSLNTALGTPHHNHQVCLFFCISETLTSCSPVSS